MDDDDIFVLKSDSENEENDSKTENANENQKESEKKKAHKKHHKKHHHSKTHHKRTKKESNDEIKPVIEKETFCINNPSDNDTNYIVNFKFELSDSSHFSEDKSTNENPENNDENAKNNKINNENTEENDENSKNSKINNENPEKNDKIKDNLQENTEKNAEEQEINMTAEQIQPNIENNISNQTTLEKFDKNSDETEIKDSTLKENENINDKKEEIPKCDVNLNSLNAVHEDKTILTPRKIYLKTNKNKTNSMLEYRILDSLDRSLNHLSEDFLDDFNLYVEEAFSYDKIFDNFLISLNSEIQETLHDSYKAGLTESNIADEFSSLDERFLKEIPHLQKNAMKKSNIEIEPIKASDFRNIQDRVLSIHQIFNEMKSENNINYQYEDELESRYENLKNAQLKRIELESIGQVQQERLNQIEEQLKDIQERNDQIMKEKFSNLENLENKNFKNSLKLLLQDFQKNSLNEEKNIDDFYKLKQKLNNQLTDAQQILFEVENCSNYIEKSFCPLFGNLNSLSFQQPLFSHRRENIISE